MVASHVAPTFASLEIPSVDGVPLAVRDFATAGPPRGAVLIAPAMAAPQDFYAPLASWLAGRGYRTMTFDYRGSGLSRRGALRDVDADVVTWGRLDATAVLRALQDRAPHAPITWLGHSLGGQLVPFVPDHIELAKIVTIATGSGYWRENAEPLRRKVWLFWFGMVPILTPLFGYFPGSRLGMVGDLPRGVVRQWRRWCLDPDYAAGAEPGASELFARVTAPITGLAFTDDEMMSRANIESIHGHYARAKVALRHIAPADVGLARIGHFGFFRPEHREVLWETVLRPELA